MGRAEIFHTLHCIIFSVYISAIFYLIYIWRQKTNPNWTCNPIEVHGWFYSILYYFSRLNLCLALPQTLLSAGGLIFLNVFRDKKISEQTREKPLTIDPKPKICVRVVTRGDYPDLINFTLEHNVTVCATVYPNGFQFELVTEQEVLLVKNLQNRVTTTFVPKNYACKNGTLFKARNWQFAMEKNMLNLKHDDWIVHLDEDTLMTESSILGILKFCNQKKRQIGHGLVTYLSVAPWNPLLYALECPVVGEHLGLIRATLRFFATPLFYVKGSFIVAQQGVEHTVGFDHGPDSCISEDYHFALLSRQLGFKWDYLDGVMHEQSNLSFIGFLKQRRRWLYGTYRLLFFAPSIRLDVMKCVGYFRFFIWVTQPLGVLAANLTSCDSITTVIGLWTVIMFGYSQMFGAIKSIIAMPKSIEKSWLKKLWLTVVALLTVPFCFVMEAVCVLYTLFSRCEMTFKVTEKFSYNKARSSIDNSLSP